MTAAKKTVGFAERLSDYCRADRTRGGAPCAMCSLPKDVIDAVRSEHEKGQPLARIARCLRDEGYAISDAGIHRHFREHEQRSR